MKDKLNEFDIDETLTETFPASDPPSWTLGREPEREFMKAIRVHAYGGPEVLSYDDVPIPQVHEGQVLVRVHAASVNPIDYKLAAGMKRPVMNNQPVNLPWIPGGDFAGIVEAVGEDVRDIQQGNVVYGNCPAGGAYAQLVVAQADQVALKPQKLNYVEAASVPLAAQTAWQALFDHGHLQENQKVLIHGGAGGVGSFAVQLAHWKKAKVWATGSADHLDYLRSLGAEETIDYHQSSFDQMLHDMDLVIDLIGGETQQRSFKVLKAGGRLISTIEPPSEELSRKHQVTALMMSMKPSSRQLNQLTELLDGRLIKVQVNKTHALPEAKEAWEEILSHHATGKIVLAI